MNRIFTVLLATALVVGGLLGVWQLPTVRGGVAQWLPAAPGRACSAPMTGELDACELLLVAHLVVTDGRTGLDAEREQALTRLDDAIGHVPGIGPVRVFDADIGGPSPRSLLNNEPAVAIGIFGAPSDRASSSRAPDHRASSADSGAVAEAEAATAADRVRAVLRALDETLPTGLSWVISYDVTRFDQHALAAPFRTLVEALLRGSGTSSQSRYLVGFAQLPDGASLARSEAVLRRMSQLAFTHPAVESAIAFPGLAHDGSGSSPNAGLVFLTLRPAAEGGDPQSSAAAIAATLDRRFARIDGAVAGVFPPAAAQRLAGWAESAPDLAAVFIGHGVGEPSLLADIDP